MCDLVQLIKGENLNALSGIIHILLQTM